MTQSSAAILSSVLMVAVAAFGQPAQNTHFDVASIKPADSDARGSSLKPTPGGGFSMRNAPLGQIIRFAYNVQDFQLAGAPRWIETDRYDILAKTGDSAPPITTRDSSALKDEQRTRETARVREMVRSLLADRFHMAVHREMREHSIYALRVAKSGNKLSVTTGTNSRQGMHTDRGLTQGSAATMAQLSDVLSAVLGRPVQDRTGLTDRYDFTVRWAADAAAAKTPDSTDSDGPSIFTALQDQLGLRLDSDKGLVETIVIDHVERPSRN